MRTISPAQRGAVEEALRLGLTDLAPSILEKDLLITDVLGMLADFAWGDVQPVFCGGTSLSKGHGVLERMSEDIDFKLVLPEGWSRSLARRQLSRLREQLVDDLRQAGFDLPEEGITALNKNRYLCLALGYAPQFPLTAALRAELRLWLLRSALGSCPPEPGVPTAMKNRQHNDATVLVLYEVNDPVGETFDQSAARLVVKDGEGFGPLADPAQLLSHFCQKAEPQAGPLIGIPAGGGAEVGACLWADPNPQGRNHGKEAAAQRACSSSSNTRQASSPGWPSKRKACNRSATSPCSSGVAAGPCCSAAIESHRVCTSSSRWCKGRFSSSEPIGCSGKPPDRNY